jgi:hypothetical protein
MSGEEQTHADALQQAGSIAQADEMQEATQEEIDLEAHLAAARDAQYAQEDELRHRDDVHPWMAPAFSESARAQLAADEAAAEALQQCFDLAVAQELEKRIAEHNKAEEEMVVTMGGMLEALRDDEARVRLTFSQDSVSSESAKLISSMQPIYSRIGVRKKILVQLRKASKKATQAASKKATQASKKATHAASKKATHAAAPPPPKAAGPPPPKAAAPPPKKKKKATKGARTLAQLREDAKDAYAASLARNAAKDALPPDETASNAEDDDDPDDDPPVPDRQQRCFHFLKVDSGPTRLMRECKFCGGDDICHHNNVMNRCVECGGSSLCFHNKRKSTCKKCGGGSICEHQRIRSQCKQCGGGSICEHQRQRSRCKECGGGGLCPHQRIRSQCKECGGAGLCPHQRRRSRCKECGGASLCPHQRQRSQCKECGGAGLCPHQRRRSQCKECGGASLCPHQRRRSRCKECGVGGKRVAPVVEAEEGGGAAKKQRGD